MRMWGPAPQDILGATQPCSFYRAAQRTWQTPQVGLLASLPSFFLDTIQDDQLLSHLCSPWLSPPWKGTAFPEFCEHSCKRGFYPNKEARIWRKVSGKEIKRQTRITTQQVLLFGTREGVAPSAGSRQHQNPRDAFCWDKHAWKNVDGKTSISWTGGTNKSFMKRIGNIIARAKRMLICFATWSNGMTGLEGCSHFGGWLLQLIQSINFAALLQAELVPSDLKLSMHLFYHKICVCVRLPN